MKILCPNCNQSITLGELKKLGRQNGFCPRCKIHIHATYENTQEHEFWDIEYEKHNRPAAAPPKRDRFGEFLSSLGYFLFYILLFGLIFAYCTMRR
jgi:hypothetical protein